MSRRANPARTLARHLREARRLHTHLDVCLARLEHGLPAALEKTAQHPVQRPAISPDPAAEHRRLYGPGVPSKIDRNPELRAFILARIDTMTLPELQDAVAGAFPPARRVRKSAIHRWWTRNRPKSHPE